ncbi:nesp036 [Neophasia sp. alphabaculovirus]|nr:nesp036 [Neophasia sp. alphabaculovirus]
MNLFWLLAFVSVLCAVFARKALPDYLALPDAHAGHLAGAPAPRVRFAYNAAEQKLQQCRAYLYD